MRLLPNRNFSSNSPCVDSSGLGIGSYRFEATPVIHGGTASFSAGVFASPIPGPKAVGWRDELRKSPFLPQRSTKTPDRERLARCLTIK